jgi:hypothetical protein
MNEVENSSLQAVVEYYRNKCNKLEHDFVLYQAETQGIIRKLQLTIEQGNERSGEEQQDEDSQS